MRKIFIILLVALFFTATITVDIQDNFAEEKKSGKNTARMAKVMGIDYPWWVPNRIGNYMSNNGLLVTDNVTGSSGMEWPAGSGNTINYASGIWLAGYKDGAIVTAVAEYATEYQPGKITGWSPGVAGTADNPQDSRYKTYIIYQSDLVNPSDDYLNWPVEDGAPVDENGDPLLIGTSTVWAVFNDMSTTLHNNILQTKTMGVEVQMLAWAFNRPDAFGDMMFFKFTFINKGGKDITDTYVSFWADIDVGDANDLVGCDTLLSLGYMYKTGSDGSYGDNPPAIGYDFFQGPIVASPGDTAFVSGRQVLDFKNLGMGSFAKYINGGPAQYSDPETGPEAYNFMLGLDLFGDPIINTQTSKVTKFWHAGDPVAGTGWLDDDHRDKRFLMTAGPFTLADGETQEVVGGMIIAQGNSGTQSVELLKQADVIAQLAYDINFALPPSPTNPVVTVSTDNKAILLQWDDLAESYEANDPIDVDEDGDPTTYTFQGYNVYQLDSDLITGQTSIKKIATFDVIDGVEKIRDDVFVMSIGQTANIFVQEGSDSGVKRFLRIDSDVLAGNAPLVQNRQYYFAVTAYGYNSYGIPKVLESPMVPTLIRPQSQPLGTDINNTFAAGDSLEVTHTGTSDGSAYAIVTDPAALVDVEYELTFRDEAGAVVWDVSSDGTTKITGWTNQGTTGNFDFPIVDGVMIQVFGPPLGIGSVDRSVTVADGGPGGDRWISGTDWGGSHLFGGLDIGANFFDSTIGAADFVVVDWRFTSDPTMSEATGWSRAYTYRRDLGYAFQSAQLGWIPCQMFDISDLANPRQLNICYVEDAAAGVADFIWNPVDAGASGGREYLFCMLSDYNPDGALYDDANFGPEADVLYALWPNARGSHPFQETNFWLRITPNFVNSSADKFTFQSKAPIKDNNALAIKQAMELINVYPNPYSGFNVEERSPIERFVTFTHLPEDKTKIKIFTLAGEIIKNINHENKTQFERLDLKNDFNIPVASGLYIVRIDMEGIGVKILKIAILAPEERLGIY